MTTTQHQSKQGGARVHFPPPLVFVGLMGTAALVQWLVVRVTVPTAPLVRFVLAAIFGVPGIALLVVAHGLFKRSGQNPVPWTPTPELLVTGIYRFTRNPIYLGMTLTTIGIAFCANDVWMIASAFVGLVVVHVIAVLPEEAYLGEKFGDAYARYKSKVRRYL